MKKIIIKITILILIILFLPYMITIFLSNTKDNARDNFFNDTNEDSNDNLEENTLELNGDEPALQVEENGDSKSISFDEYLMGAVAANIQIDYELETIKAQAVIVRTYALKALEYLKDNGNDTPKTKDIGLSYMNRTDMEEKWGENYEDNYQRIENAVFSTKNEVLTIDHELIEPLFHEVSVGKTRSSLEAWGDERSYLSSVDSSEDVTSPNYMKITQESLEDVIQELKDSLKGVTIKKDEFFDKVVVIKRDSLGYVLKISVGKRELSGEEFAKILKLNSSNFYIENYEGKVRFICKGKGHGVGLSQFGANVMAQKGKTYKEILDKYYKNTTISVYKN